MLQTVSQSLTFLGFLLFFCYFRFSLLFLSNWFCRTVILWNWFSNINSHQIISSWWTVLLSPKTTIQVVVSLGLRSDQIFRQTVIQMKPVAVLMAVWFERSLHKHRSHSIVITLWHKNWSWALITDFLSHQCGCQSAGWDYQVEEQSHQTKGEEQSGRGQASVT